MISRLFTAILLVRCISTTAGQNIKVNEQMGKMPGIKWMDNRGLVPPFHFPVPKRTFILLIPPNCPKEDQQGMLHVWTHLDALYPHYLWTADCSIQHTQQVCMMAMKKHWLDAGGPQLLVWKKGSFHPFQGDKNVESFAKAVDLAYKRYMSSISRIHEDGKMNLIQALVNHEQSKGSVQSLVEGNILMLTNQLPAWFNCTEYGLRPGGTDGLALQVHPAAFVVQDFIPFLSMQRQYGGDAWNLRWRVNATSRHQSNREHSSTLSFQWTENEDTDDEKLVNWRTVHVLEMVEGKGDNTNSYRTCSLEWSNSDIKDQQQEYYQLDSGGQIVVERNVDTKNLQIFGYTGRLQIELDTGRAYDWLRFRFLEFADAVRKRIMQSKVPNPNQPLVVYDPVAGSCWFPLLVRAALQSSNFEVHSICSDISPDAINVARRDFNANKIEEAEFLVGDLFEPLLQKQRRNGNKSKSKNKRSDNSNTLRPDVVYYLPPHEVRPEGFGDPMRKNTMNVPEMSVFVPESEERYYFFHRLAKELPPLLAERATVFISVSHGEVDDVLKLMKSYEQWPEPEILLSRTIVDGPHERLFFNPSGLIEYQF